MDLVDSLKTIFNPNTAQARELKTQAIALLIYSLTKTYPRIIKYSDYTEIVLNEKQIEASRNYFEDLLTSKPGEVRIVGTSKILIPELIKKYWPWIAGTLGAGYLAGKIL